MKKTPKNMFWIRPKNGPVLTTTLEQWRETDQSVWIEIVESTLQGLISRAEMVEATRPIFAGCLIEREHHILDVESTLEFARWLCATRRSAMIWVPLEPSSLSLFDRLPVDAFCLDPLWPHLGVGRIQCSVLKWFENQTEKPIVLRIDPNIIHVEDLDWLRTEGWYLNTEVEV